MKIETAAKLAELAGDTVIAISIVGFGVLFAMKLIEKIDWSWWIVMAPLYGGIPVGFTITIGTILLLVLRERAAVNGSVSR